MDLTILIGHMHCRTPEKSWGFKDDSMMPAPRQLTTVRKGNHVQNKQVLCPLGGQRGARKRGIYRERKGTGYEKRLCELSEPLLKR